MNKRILSVLILILALTVPFLPGEIIAQGELVILHTNDLHGQSLAKIATLVENHRAVHPNLLLVDGGDLFSGTPISSIFKGEVEEKAVKALGYDALAIGNHDFDFGKDVFLRSLENGIPWLAANIFKEDGTNLAPPFLIKEVGKVRVLLVGLTTEATPKMSFPKNVEGLHFSDPVIALQKILQEQDGTFDLCIVLSHLGYGEDLLLAQRVQGIHIIIGGHSHTQLSKPVRIRDTIITQTGSSAQYLGKIVIDLEEGYAVQSELIRIEQTIPDHPFFLALDEEYDAILAVEMDQILGYSSRGSVKNSMGLLLIQALSHYAEADAVLYNGGGVRSGLPQGAVTRRDVFAVEPFGNEAVVVTLTGPDFAELVKLKSSRSSDFYQGPKLVDLDQTYTVATSDFLTSESSSYPMLSRGQIMYLGMPVREVLENYLRDHMLDQQPKAISF